MTSLKLLLLCHAHTTAKFNIDRRYKNYQHKTNSAPLIEWQTKQNSKTWKAKFTKTSTIYINTNIDKKTN